MSRRKRAVAMAVAVVFVVFAGRVAWLARPMPTVQELKVDGSGQHLVVYSRTYSLLPLSEWGVDAYRAIGCGSLGTVRSECREFGFFAVTDTWITTAVAGPATPGSTQSTGNQTPNQTP